MVPVDGIRSTTAVSVAALFACRASRVGYAQSMKKNLGAVAVASALALGAFPSDGHAYCVGWDKTLPNYDPQYYSVSHELRRSEWVVKAKVIKETWIGDDGKEKPLQPPFQNGAPRPWGFDPYAGAFYDLQVEQAFKGTPPPTIRVFSENATNRFWLKEGQEILAFVSEEAFEEPIGKQFTLDTCGNFRTYPKAKEIVAAVLKAAKVSK